MNIHRLISIPFGKWFDNMEPFTAIAIGTSTVLGFLASLVGGWDFLMDTLVLLMVIDVLLGIAISMWKHRSHKTKSGRFASKEFYKGITRKFLCFIVIIVAVALDNLTGTYVIIGSLQVTLLRSVVVVFYILCEATSIIENLSLLGVPMPKKLLDMLEILKESNNNRGDISWTF